jgi:NADPH:quinone reductase-like Zn-dependent oxidoreductase
LRSSLALGRRIADPARPRNRNSQAPARCCRAGEYARHAQSKFPLIPGRDFAGVISAVSNGVVDLKIDDAVFGVCEAGQEGAYAEKIAVKAAIIAKKPEGLSHVNAAALALTGLTAISAVARPFNHFPAARTHAPEKQGWKLIIILGCFLVYLIHPLPSP